MNSEVSESSEIPSSYGYWSFPLTFMIDHGSAKIEPRESLSSGHGFPYIHFVTATQLAHGYQNQSSQPGEEYSLPVSSGT